MNKKLINLLIIIGIFLIANLLVLDIIWLGKKGDAKEAMLGLLNKTDDAEESIEPEASSERSLPADETSGLGQLSLSEANEADYLKICQQEIAKAVATLSAQINKSDTTVKTVYQQSSAPSHPSVVYAPLGGGSSTTTRDWQDSGSAEAYFNKADYPGAKKISFEVFLKVKHSAGEANVRLYDASHGFVIGGSELLGGSEQFEKKSTGALDLLDGNNLYKVQFRSTTGYEAYMESPRLKIEY